MRGIHRALAAAIATAVIFVSPIASAEWPKPTYDHHPPKRSAVSAQRSAKSAQAKPTATTRTKAKPSHDPKPAKAKTAPKPKPAKR